MVSFTNLLTASSEMSELSDFYCSAKENVCFSYAKKIVCFLASFVWLLRADSSSGKYSSCPVRILHCSRGV